MSLLAMSVMNPRSPWLTTTGGALEGANNGRRGAWSRRRRNDGKIGMAPMSLNHQVTQRDRST